MAVDIDETGRCTPNGGAGENTSDGRLTKFQQNAKDLKKDGWCNSGTASRSAPLPASKTKGQQLPSDDGGTNLKLTDARASTKDGPSIAPEATGADLLGNARKSYGNKNFLAKWGADAPGVTAGEALGGKIRQEGQMDKSVAVLKAMLDRCSTPQERQDVASALTHSIDAGRRRSLARMVSAGLVQTKGLASLLCSRM